MKIFREKDFDRDTFWKVFIPGVGVNETAEDVIKRRNANLEQSGVKPIAETAKVLHCGDTIDINGSLYHIGICGRDYCAVEDIKQIDLMPEEREYDNELHCPYCGAEIPDTFEFCDNGEHECQYCGATFEFEREIEIRWNSYPAKPPRIKKI